MQKSTYPKFSDAYYGVYCVANVYERFKYTAQMRQNDPKSL